MYFFCIRVVFPNSKVGGFTFLIMDFMEVGAVHKVFVERSLLDQWIYVSKQRTEQACRRSSLEMLNL